MRTHPKTPKLLPWLAKKAGITERRATTLWHESERWAERRAAVGSSAYYKLAVDRLLELAAAESLREDAASFGWRPWARAQARFWALSMQMAQEGSTLMARGWRLLASTASTTSLRTERLSRWRGHRLDQLGLDDTPVSFVNQYRIQP